MIGAPDAEGEFRLTRNPRFHSWSAADRPDGLPDSILFRPPSTTGDRIAAVERGDADLAYVDNGGEQFSADRLRGLLTRYPSRIASLPELGSYFVFLNVREPPFDDPRVRRAVNLATDRERMVALTGGTETSVPACGSCRRASRTPGRTARIPPIRPRPARGPRPTWGPRAGSSPHPGRVGRR